jgi:hypothetical protein
MTDRNLPDAPSCSTSPKIARLKITKGLNTAKPDTFHPAPAASEWIARKEARGQSVNLDHIGTPHHLIERHDTIEAATCRAMSRARAYIAKTGITGPTPLIA